MDNRGIFHMTSGLWTKACLLAAISLPSLTQAGEVPIIAPHPSWVKPAGALSPEMLTKQGFLLMDRQMRAEGDSVSTYVDYAFRAASPEQLQAIGAMMLQWHPDKGDVFVHKLEIIRDGTIIPLSVTAKDFAVLRREQALEQQALNGILTATYQVPGLKTGDTVRFAFSIQFRDPALGGNVSWSVPHFMEPFQVDSANVRISLPADGRHKWRSSMAHAAPVTSVDGGRTEVVFKEPLPKAPDMPEDAPLRFRPPALIDLTSFADWRAVSMQGEQIYRAGRDIDPASDLAKRVADIEKTSSDPLTRTAGALRLVQDEIRYLFNGQAQGNYVPQTVKETWTNKYGDCKAKTLLLLALLDRLGIKAEAALVHSSQGDLLASRLPSFNAFDHVIVRAEISGEIYWLDGTQIGGRLETLIENPSFRNALPLRAAGSDLEKIPLRLSSVALTADTLELDASAGLAMPKMFKLTSTLRGPEAVKIKVALPSINAEARRELIAKVVADTLSNALVLSSDITIDEATGIARLEATGIAELNWQQEDDQRFGQLESVLDSFSAEADRARPAWKDIPVNVVVDQHKVSNVTLKLPKSATPFSLGPLKVLDEQIWGVRIKRAISLSGDVVKLNELARSEQFEVAAAELPKERERFARLAKEQIKIIAPESYPLEWQEFRTARKEGRVKAIEAAFAAYIAKDPKKPEGYLRRSEFYTSLKEKNAAIADLTKVISLEPDANSYQTRAWLNQFSNPKAALADIAEAQKIDPASTYSAQLYARLMSRQGKFDEALAAIENAQSLQEDKYALIAAQSETLLKAGRKDEALAKLAAASKGKPGNASLVSATCWAKGLANLDLPTALKECSKAIELSESPAGDLHSRSLVYFRMGRFEDALADIDAAFKIQPETGDFYYLRGIIRSWTGDAAGSAQDIADAKYIDEEVPEIYDMMGIKAK
jgi:tetratricopeptide (TPR) repeat protein